MSYKIAWRWLEGENGVEGGEWVAKHLIFGDCLSKQTSPNSPPAPGHHLLFKSISLQQSYGRNIIGRRESSDRFQPQHLKSIMKNRGEGLLHNVLVLIEWMKFVPNIRSSLIA